MIAKRGSLVYLLSDYSDKQKDQYVISLCLRLLTYCNGNLCIRNKPEVFPHLCLIRNPLLKTFFYLLSLLLFKAIFLFLPLAVWAPESRSAVVFWAEVFTPRRTPQTCLPEITLVPSPTVAFSSLGCYTNCHIFTCIVSYALATKEGDFQAQIICVPNAVVLAQYQALRTLRTSANCTINLRRETFCFTPSLQRPWQNKSIIFNVYIHNIFNIDDPEFLWLCIMNLFDRALLSHHQ